MLKNLELRFASDRQIDQLVYELYGLTEEEIRAKGSGLIIAIRMMRSWGLA